MKISCVWRKAKASQTTLQTVQEARPGGKPGRPPGIDARYGAP